MNRSFCQFVIALIVLSTGLIGCGAQQFSPGGRELLKPLQTAISARNLQWLEATEERLMEQFEDGRVSDAECNAMLDIIETSRSGEWKEAERNLFSLIDGQRATRHDLAALRSDPRQASAKQKSRTRG